MDINEESGSESDSEELDRYFALQCQFQELCAARLQPEELQNYRQDFETHLNGLIDEEFEFAINSLPDENDQARSNQMNLDAIIAEEITRFSDLRIENENNDHLNPNDEEFDVIRFGQIIFDETNKEDQEHVQELQEEQRDSPVRLPRLTDIVQEQALFECSLCIEKLPLEESENFGCAHLYCKSCLANFFTSKVNDGDVLDMECPEEGCDLKANDNLIRSLLPRDKITRYESFVFKKITDKFDDVMNCPQCNEPVECDLTTCNGICNKCNCAFCTSCGKEFHGADDCPNIAQRLEESQMSIQMIERNFKQCPGCKTNIEKDEIGCNHMKCWKCSTEFCWICLTKLTTNKLEFERHFSSCELFPHNFED